MIMKKYISLILIFFTFKINALEVNLVWKENQLENHMQKLIEFSNINEIPFEIKDTVNLNSTKISIINFDNEKKELDNQSLINMLYKTELFSDVFYLN